MGGCCHSRYHHHSDPEAGVLELDEAKITRTGVRGKLDHIKAQALTKSIEHLTDDAGNTKSYAEWRRYHEPEKVRREERRARKSIAAQRKRVAEGREHTESKLLKKAFDVLARMVSKAVANVILDGLCKLCDDIFDLLRAREKSEGDSVDTTKLAAVVNAGGGLLKMYRFQHKIGAVHTVDRSHRGDTIKDFYAGKMAFAITDLMEDVARKAQRGASAIDKLAVGIGAAKPTEESSTDRTAGAAAEHDSANADADTMVRSTSYTAAMGQPAADPVPAHTATQPIPERLPLLADTARDAATAAIAILEHEWHQRTTKGYIADVASAGIFETDEVHEGEEDGAVVKIVQELKVGLELLMEQLTAVAQTHLNCAAIVARVFVVFVELFEMVGKERDHAQSVANQLDAAAHSDHHLAKRAIVARVEDELARVKTHAHSACVLSLTSLLHFSSRLADEDDEDDDRHASDPDDPVA
eukprot:m.212277 g.212277  ORF g.212277 m.212277 type:complete len:470 (-) comp25524_c0_seq1:100-1509(-)